MKSLLTCLLLCSGLPVLFAQKPNYAYRLPASPDMPEWATKLYRDDIEVNVFDLDEAYETWENAHEADEKVDRPEWTDSGEEPTFEENIWEEYFQRWRTAVQPFVQPDGSLRFDPAFLPSFKAQGPAPENSTVWSLIGPEKTYWSKNDNSAQPLAPWQANIFSFAIAPSDPGFTIPDQTWTTSLW